MAHLFTFVPLRIPKLATIADLFGVDVRSLALLRIFLGAIILADLAIRATTIPEHYGDLSVLPTHLIQTFWPFEWAWSFHTLFGGPSYLVKFLFAAHAVAAFAMLVGYRTRATTAITWLLLVSLQHANPLLLDRGDDLLRAILFVSMFLPLGSTWSVDSMKRGSAPTPSRVCNAWTAAFLLQLAFFYFFAATHKVGMEWVETGNAVYYAMSSAHLKTSAGAILLQYPDLLRFLTFGVVSYQYIAPFLLFFPLFLTFTRGTALAGLTFMHVSFAALMHLGHFSWISLAALIAFVPTGCWIRISRAVDTRWSGDNRDNRVMLRPSPRPSAQMRLPEGVTSVAQQATSVSLNMLGVLYIAHIFVWHASTSPLLERSVQLPARLDTVGKILRIEPYADMFSPNPTRSGGWFVVPGLLASGQSVDLFRGGTEISFDRPDVFSDYVFVVRRNLMTSLWGNYPQYRTQYAEYLCQKWNMDHGDRLERLELIFVEEETPPPGEPYIEPRPVTLLSWECQDI